MLTLTRLTRLARRRATPEPDTMPVTISQLMQAYAASYAYLIAADGPFTDSDFRVVSTEITALATGFDDMWPLPGIFRTLCPQFADATRRPAAERILHAALTPMKADPAASKPLVSALLRTMDQLPLTPGRGQAVVHVAETLSQNLLTVTG